MYVATKWSLFIKKITVAYQVKEQNYSLNDFPSVKYNPWVSCWGWPLSSVCTNVNGCVCDLNFSNVPEDISITLLTSWDHDPDRPSNYRGIPTGRPIILWTKDCNGLSGASCGVEGFAWLEAASFNGTSNITGRHVEETDFKFFYFVPLI